MNAAFFSSRPWRFLHLVVLLAFIGAMLFLLARPGPTDTPPAPLVVMDPSYKIPRQKVSLFDRWVPMRPGWGWLWRLKETIVGRRKIITLEGAVWDLSGISESALSGLCPAQPDFSGTNGLKAWLLSNTGLVELRARLKQTPGCDLLFLPRIMTGEGGQAGMHSGPSIGSIPAGGAGLDIDLVSRLRQTNIDLISIVSLSALVTNAVGNDAVSPLPARISVQTNFTAASRAQFPNGGGVFFLDSSPAGPGQKRVGVILSASVPPKG
jgi:hypothetical protein